MNQWQSKHGNHVFIRQRKSVILSKYLGPTLKNAGLETKKLPFGIIIEICSQRASTILDPQASNTSGELVSIGMKAGVVEIQCLIMLVKFTKCILKKLAFTEGCREI
jgi:hypothetical protein